MGSKVKVTEAFPGGSIIQIDSSPSTSVHALTAVA